MRVPGLATAHLTYCLNVHPGSSLAEAETAVFEHAPRVFATLSEQADAGPPFGVGMWLSAQAARELDDPARLGDFAERLAGAGLYAFTLNGFPYGRFHGAGVKESVYRPDWATAQRRDYTLRLARILGALLPEGVEGSISTLPVTFGPWATEEKLEAAVRNLAAVAAALHRQRLESGRQVVLALEPEPGCVLETTDDVAAFFARRLVPRGVVALGEEHGLGAADAERILRRHVGVCLDTTHTGVMAEDPTEGLRRLAADDIRVAKVQLGAALRVDVGEDAEAVEALAPFRDEVYLHQVVVLRARCWMLDAGCSMGERRGRPGVGSSRLQACRVFYADLPEALDQQPLPRGQWRVHYHVPLAWDGEGAMDTTREQVSPAFLRAALDCGVEHFESEIYTLDVFPGATEAREAILARDLAWLLGRFAAARGL